MSDQELRELERRWKSTGSTDDEAAFLLERVRTGELWPERLELASYMAHAAAVVALGNRAPKVPANEGEWLDSLYARWGQEAFIRAILAAVAYLDHDRHENPLLVEAVSLAEQWISGVSKAVPTLAMPTQRNSPPKAKKITALYIHQALVRPSDWEPGLWWEALLRAHPEAQEALRREVADWSLGYRDPVADRIKGRRIRLQGTDGPVGTEQLG